MRVWDVILNIISFGGYGRCQKAIATYTKLYKQYRHTYNKALQRKEAVTAILRQLGIATNTLMKDIKKAQSILIKQLHTSTRRAINIDANSTKHEIALPGYSQATSIVSGYNSVLTTAGALGTGSAVAIGSWTLVTMFGVASTGTAISTLSGVALTNATLAWFGGGALAAGGAGMAGGMVTLGALVAIPAIAFIAWSSHSKAAEVEKAIEELKPELNKVTAIYNDIIRFEGVASDKLSSLKEALAQFEAALAVINRKVFPLRIISCAVRRIRTWFGGNYYQHDEQHHLYILDQALLTFVMIFNQK